MTFDLTLTITAIIALAAIISPVLVAIINNHHQIKIKQLEINEKYVILTFQNYLSQLEQCSSMKTATSFGKYRKAYGQALLYASSESKALMEQIDDLLQYDDTPVLSSELIFAVSNSLRTDIKRVKK